MDVLSISATVFGFVALAGGAAGYFKASRGDSIIKYQATEIALRDGKIANLEKDLATTITQCSTKDETIAELKKHNAYLQKLPQGGAHLKKLTEVIERQGKAAEKAFSASETLAKQVKGLLAREGK